MHLLLIVSANHSNNVKRILQQFGELTTFTNRNREQTIPYIYLNNSLTILLSACPRLCVNRAEPVNRAPDYVYMYEKLKETELQLAKSSLPASAPAYGLAWKEYVRLIEHSTEALW